MKPEELAEIKRLEAAAPAGPWTADHYGTNSVTTVHIGVSGEDGQILFDNLNADVRKYEVCEETDESLYINGPAARALEFAAGARSAVPQLIAEVERLQAMNDSIRGEVAKIVQSVMVRDRMIGDLQDEVKLLREALESRG